MSGTTFDLFAIKTDQTGYAPQFRELIDIPELTVEAIETALGFTPADDSAVVHKTGDTMTGKLTVGSGGVENSVDPMVNVTRNLVSGSTNGHAFSDSSHFARNSLAYNSFDARISMGGSGHVYDHYAAFQSIPVLTAGTLSDYYGLYSEPVANSGASISRAYALYVAPGQRVAENWSLYSPSPEVKAKQNGPMFFGPTGAVSGSDTSLEIGHNIYYDPVRGDWFGRNPSSYYTLIEPHDPGSNSLAIFTGLTPANVSDPVSDYHVSLRCTDDATAIGPSGVWLYGSRANFLQFGGTTNSFPAIKRNGTAINFRLADDSADAPITTGAITVSGPIGANGATPVRPALTVSSSLADLMTALNLMGLISYP